MYKTELPVWLLTYEIVFGWVFCGLVLFRWMCGLLFCGPGSCWRSPALMSVWQWGNTEWWRKMAVYLYRKHSSKTVVQIQHRPPRACPTVGIKHKCGTLRILGHLRECLNPPPTHTHTLFLFLLPLSSSFPPSLFLVAPTPVHHHHHQNALWCIRIPPCKERKWDCNRTQWLFFSGCSLVLWCVVLVTICDCWSFTPTLINKPSHAITTQTCLTIHALPHVHTWPQF